MEELEGQGFVEISVMLGSGVYALCYNGRVVYIGKAKQLLSRLYTHRSLWERVRKGYKVPRGGKWGILKAVRFDRVFVVPCKEIDLDRVEGKMIRLFNPKLNVHYRSTEAKRTLAELGFDIFALRGIAPTPEPQRITRRI